MNKGSKSWNVFFTYVAVAMIAFGGIAASLSIFIGDNSSAEDNEPKYNVNYYDGTNPAPIYSEKRYLYEDFDIRFDIVPQKNEVFLGWSLTKDGDAKYKTDVNTGTGSLTPGGNRTHTMEEGGLDLYAVWATPITATMGTGGVVTINLPTTDTTSYYLVTNNISSTKVTSVKVLGGNANATNYIIISGLTISAVPGIDLSGAVGTVKLQFSGTNKLSTTNDGILLKNATGLNLILEGRKDSSLSVERTATGTTEIKAAAIGGTSGLIQIESGTVNVTVKAHRIQGAGIGGSDSGNVGKVTINGGDVSVSMTSTNTSTSGSVGINAAGIGGGGHGKNGTAEGNGIVTITGGNVQVLMMSYNRCISGAGIGGGANTNSGQRGASGDVNISGGNVGVWMWANNSQEFKGAAIGGGGGFSNSSGTGSGGAGNVNISGGTVTTYRNDPQTSNKDIGGAAGGANNVIITGGTVQVSGEMTYATTNGTTSVSKHGLNASAAIDTYTSMLVNHNGVKYKDFKVTSKHKTGSFDISRTVGVVTDIKFVPGTDSSNLYVYLPSSANNDVSLEYGTQGKVLFFDDISSSSTNNPKANAGTTILYYRVRYFFDGLYEVKDHVHAEANKAFTNNLDLSDTDKTARPNYVWIEEAGIFKLVSGADAVNHDHNYVRSTGAVSDTAVTGKLVFVATVMTEFTITYDPALDDPNKGIDYGTGTPEVVAVGEGLEFNITPKKGYIIESVSWKLGLSSTEYVLPADSMVGGVYTYKLTKAQVTNNVTITVTTSEVYEIEESITGNGTSSLPSYIYHDTDLEFTISTQTADHLVTSVKWALQSTPDVTKTITSVDGKYTIPRGELNGHIIVYIEIVETRSLSLSLSYSGESPPDVQFDVTPADAIVARSNGGNTITIFYKYGANISITITNNESNGAIKKIEYEKQDSGEGVQNWTDIPDQGKSTTITFSAAVDHYTIWVHTIEAINVIYEDNNDIEYNEGIRSPDFVEKGQPLNFEIHAHFGSKITKVSYKAVFEEAGKNDVILDEGIVGSGATADQYKLDYKDKFDEANKIIITIETIYSYEFIYTPPVSDEFTYVTTPGYIDEDQYVDIEIERNANYLITKVRWSSTDSENRSVGGDLVYQSSDGNIHTYRLIWPSGEDMVHPFGEKITITVVTQHIYNIFYEDDGNVEYGKKPDYVVDDGSYFEVEATGSVERGSAFRILEAWYTVGTSDVKVPLDPSNDQWRIGPEGLTGDVHIHIRTIEIYFVTYMGGSEVLYNGPEYVDSGNDLRFTASIIGKFCITSETWTMGSETYNLSKDIYGYYILADELNGSVVVTIETIDAFYLTVWTPTGGTVTLKLNGIDTVLNYDAGVLIPKNAEVTLTVTEDDSYRFEGWYVDSTKRSSDLVYTFLMNDDFAVTATLQELFTVDVSKNISEGDGPTIDGNASKEMAVGDSATIVANDIDGFRFDHWEVLGVSVGNDNPFIYEHSIDTPVTFVAVYIQLCTITVETSGDGKVTPEYIVVDFGTDVTFTFDPADRIISVVLDGVNITDQIVDGTFTIYDVSSDHHIVVLFESEPLPYMIIFLVVAAIAAMTAFLLWLRSKKEREEEELSQ